MRCPICTDSTLVMNERQGVEIDYCPQCRGIWLDRGELDKIIERSMEGTARNIPEQEDRRPREYREEPRKEHHRSDGYGYNKKKKSSFLGDLFDF